MNTNLTELIFILDRSGSMEHLSTETIGGFNSLIEKQKKETAGEAYVTTVLFDDQYELLHDHTPLKDVPRLTSDEYYARGCTAMLDAVGRTIDNVGMRLANTPEDQRPGQILVVITTDGYENASRDYTKKKVKEMITLQQNTYNWKFLFLGADIDAVGEADSIGIRTTGACTASATSKGVSSSFHAVEKIVGFMRCAPMAAKGGVDMDDDDFDCACAEAFKVVE